jgi:hypothetical protein
VEDLQHSAAMLVNQILTEEEIHHLLLRTMATWLSDLISEQGTQPPQATAPKSSG